MKIKNENSRIVLLLFISEDWYFWSHRLPLAQSAIDRGWQVCLVTRVSTYQKKIEDGGIRVIPLKRFKRGFQNPLKDLFSLFELYMIYKKVSPTIVQHVALKPIVLGTIAAHMNNIRCIFNTFAGMGSLFTKIDRKSTYLSDFIYLVFKILFKPISVRLIFQNASDRDKMLKKKIVKKARAALIKGSGVNVGVFKPSKNSSSEIPIVLLASRMLWDKGIGEFVEAARRINSEGTKARFVLVGDPDDENPRSILRSQLKQWHRSGYIEWWGHRNNMAEVYAQAQIFCLPSYREGLPKAILEACATGKPVVTTDAIGCRDIIRHGKNGLLVQPCNARELAEAIKTLLEDPDRRYQLGKKGREIVVKEYTEEIIIHQTFRQYLSGLKLTINNERQCARH